MGYKILLADDEAEIRDVLRIYLEKDGYVVTEAADGVEAMNLLRKEPFDRAVEKFVFPYNVLLAYHFVQRSRTQSGGQR